MSAQYVHFIQDVVIILHANIRELNERKAFADAGEIDHIEGKLLAYREVISLLQSSAVEFRLPLSELGLSNNSGVGT